MLLFDSHVHLADERFDADLDETVNKCIADGVGWVLENATDRGDFDKVMAIAEKYDIVYAAIGIHPHSAKDAEKEHFEYIEELLKHRKVKAIGEIGLDYHYDFSPRADQIRVFETQLELAKKTNFPVVIHMREATEDTLAVLKNAGKVAGTVHCFSGSMETAELLLNMGYYLGFDGPITFKNAKKALEIVKMIPEDKILIETDCPYLTPVPFRGERNYPGYVKLVAEKIAEVRETNVEHIAEITAQNAKKLFRI